MNDQLVKPDRGGAGDQSDQHGDEDQKRILAKPQSAHRACNQDTKSCAGGTDVTQDHYREDIRDRVLHKVCGVKRRNSSEKRVDPNRFDARSNGA